MADAVGVASSITAFIKDVVILINYVKDVYNAPAEISQFLKELKYLKIYLSAVDELMSLSTEKEPWLKTLKQLDDNPPDSVFNELMKLLEELDKKLHVTPPQTSVEEDLKRIERLKTLVMSAVQVDHITLSHAMIADVKGTVDVVLIDKLKERFGNTGEWFLKLPEFKSWKDGSTESRVLCKDPIFNAVLFTPLAAINFNGGKERADPLMMASIGKWFPGKLGSMKIQAATNTLIAAMQYTDAQEGVHIRMDCQASGAIKEFCNDLGHWFRGATLPVALSGSSLAAVAYWWNGLQLRVYHQTDDVSIKEHYIGKHGKWFPDFGKAPGCVPISALGYVTSAGGPELLVYWRNLENQIVGTKNVDSWAPVPTVVGGLKVALSSLRLSGTPDDSVLEMVNDGASWVGGATVGNARYTDGNITARVCFIWFPLPISYE
ncbi:hypothetical protein ARMSODRAFT_976168 [Armillaria solidipes]|uniref:Uncharacterized protein n=1 Tax=Armillaria solidipes TaxID=1076256 RepID=A0A2H3BBV3_9AGAR|nr:hypothetical protein ARMSODRAFT_976168 [Armillaria solidipes]